MNDVYFAKEGEVGMTSTTGSYYCNIAKELQEEAAGRLMYLKFVNTSVAVIGSEQNQLMSKGVSNLDSINKDLQTQSSMFAFCAWIREAIKAKEELQNKVNRMTLEEWVEAQGLSLPEHLSYPSDLKYYSEQDVIDSWDIAKRFKYLKLEAFAAHYGKLIHPKGSYSNARKAAHEAVSNPITKDGSGRDMVFYYKNPSVDVKEIDAKFLELQNIYRGYEKELNQMKFEIKDSLNKLNCAVDEEFENKLAEWEELNKTAQVAISELRTQFNTWRTKELDRISKLKIVVPDDLKATFKVILEASK